MSINHFWGGSRDALGSISLRLKCQEKFVEESKSLGISDCYKVEESSVANCWLGHKSKTPNVANEFELYKKDQGTPPWSNGLGRSACPICRGLPVVPHRKSFWCRWLDLRNCPSHGRGRT